MAKPSNAYQQLMASFAANFSPIPTSLLVDGLVSDIIMLTTEAYQKGTFDEDRLRFYLSNLLRRAEGIARVDEIQRVQKNTLDADSDVWSQNDKGELISLTDRLNMLLSRP